jgi:hypothetical protein
LLGQSFGALPFGFGVLPRFLGPLAFGFPGTWPGVWGTLEKSFGALRAVDSRLLLFCGRVAVPLCNGRRFSPSVMRGAGRED